MFGTQHKTSYGLKYILITPAEWVLLKMAAMSLHWTNYDINQVELHILNCGYGILDAEYQMPIDNEYDLDEIYSNIKEGKVTNNN